MGNVNNVSGQISMKINCLYKVNLYNRMDKEGPRMQVTEEGTDKLPLAPISKRNVSL